MPSPTVAALQVVAGDLVCSAEPCEREKNPSSESVWAHSGKLALSENNHLDHTILVQLLYCTRLVRSIIPAHHHHTHTCFASL